MKAVPLLRLINLIAPHECLKCGNEGKLICDNCLTSAVIAKAATCYRCNRLSSYGRTCAVCRRTSSVSGVTVASYYDGVVKELIQKIKFGGAGDAAGLAARLLSPLLDAGQYDRVTAVPTTNRRYRQRGYNQAELIARAVATNLHLPYSNLLFRSGTVRQLGAVRQQRLRQLQGSFGVTSRSRIAGKRILLIDDVITTGATMTECAGALKAAGATRVWGAVLAKH
jgi:competence protein ComFC